MNYFILHIKTLQHFITSNVADLVQHAVAGRQITGVDEKHCLFTGLVEETPFKVEQGCVQYNIGNSTSVDRETSTAEEAYS